MSTAVASTSPSRRLPPAEFGLWSLAVIAATANIVSLVQNAKPLGVDWRAPGGTLLDFRDLVVVPGRYLWRGGNPYDPGPYLAAHPWAQEFDPYSPAWLFISAAIGWMPHRLAAVVYLMLMTAVSFMFARLLAQWAWPRWSAVLAPLVAIWFQVWFPARGLGSSFLVVFGIGLTLIFMPRQDTKGQWLAALGISLSVLKPQFGLPFVVLLLAMGQVRIVMRGALVAVASALPPLIACIVAAGGILEFVRSIIRVVKHATSPDAPTGLLATDSYRVDLPGLVVRAQGQHPGPWPTLLALALFIFVAVILYIKRPDAHVAPMLMAPAIYFLPVHLTYDIAILVVALAGVTRVAIVHRDTLSRVGLGFALLPVAHLHRISSMAGFSSLATDLMDAAAVALALVVGTALVGGHRRHTCGIDEEIPKDIH